MKRKDIKYIVIVIIMIVLIVLNYVYDNYIFGLIANTVACIGIIIRVIEAKKEKKQTND